MSKRLISTEELKALLTYNKRTGEFRNKIARKHSTKGKVVGSLNSNGYVEFSLGGRYYLAHRLAWFYVHGVWPTGFIDHANQIRSDNRIANLREATRAQNKVNAKLHRNNKLGVLGVYARENKTKTVYCAQLKVDGKLLHIGTFSTIHEAAAAHKRAHKKHNGAFA